MARVLSGADVGGSSGDGHERNAGVALQDTTPGRAGPIRNVTARCTLPCMYVHETRLRVRYGETDRMGFVYYGDYAEYYEVGRVEALRALGHPYGELEEQGVQLPVRDLHVTYHRPARYDDLLTVRTTITELPAVRIHFRYEVLGPDGTLLNEASTTLVFVDAATGRPKRAPEELVKALEPYFPSAS